MTTTPVLRCPNTPELSGSAPKPSFGRQLRVLMGRVAATRKRAELPVSSRRRWHVQLAQPPPRPIRACRIPTLAPGDKTRQLTAPRGRQRRLHNYLRAAKADHAENAQKPGFGDAPPAAEITCAHFWRCRSPGMHPGDRKLYGDQAPSPTARRPHYKNMVFAVFSRPPQYRISVIPH